MGLVKFQISSSLLSVVLAIWNFAHVLTAIVSISWWGFKVQMERFANWWCHISALYWAWICHSLWNQYLWEIYCTIVREVFSQAFKTLLCFGRVLMVTLERLQQYVDVSLLGIHLWNNELKKEFAVLAYIWKLAIVLKKLFADLWKRI